MSISLVDEMIAAHGNLAAWNQYNRIITTLSFGGLAFRIKFNYKGYLKRRYIISLGHPMITIENFPKAGQQGIFTPDIVWIESFDGKKIRERQHPRKFIRQWPHSYFWDDLDLLYFAGYACWNYFNIPFLLVSGQFQFCQLPDWEENGKRLQRIEVIFPDQIPTHCRKQLFYLNETKRIVRFDYDPEVFASWARAAQYCYNYQSFNGIWLPTKRKVVPRKTNGNAGAAPVLVWIEVDELHFQ